MTRMIILLRGINVSGRNKVPMAELRSALADGGFEDVATYIQSGNIAVDTELDEDALADEIENLLVERFDVDVPAVPVAQHMIAEREAQAPFPSDADPAIHLIYFARGEVDVAGIQTIDPTKHLGDTITATTSAVYVAYGQGQSKSKLTVDQLEKAAGTVLTGRNLRSVAKLKNL